MCVCGHFCGLSLLFRISRMSSCSLFATLFSACICLCLCLCLCLSASLVHSQEPSSLPLLFLSVCFSLDPFDNACIFLSSPPRPSLRSASPLFLPTRSPLLSIPLLHPRPLYPSSPAGVEVRRVSLTSGDTSHKSNSDVRMREHCVRVCTCGWVCVRACESACLCACVYVPRSIDTLSLCGARDNL